METPQGTIRATPKVLTDARQGQPVDWILVATKTYSAESTRPWIEALNAQGTRVAIIQNGVEHGRVFEGIVPAERLVPVMINLPAARSAPGRIVQSRHGIVAVPAGQNGEDFCALFAHTEIEAKAKNNRAEIEQLARDMKSGKVTASQLEDVALRK